MLTVESLVGTPHLGLEVLAGERGLERPVVWAHVSEIEDGADWLDGRELILSTGMGLPEEGRRQARYVARLAEAGAAGLAIGLRSHGISEEMTAEANRLGFPLMSVGGDVPYLVICRFVAAANQDAAMRRLTTQIRLFDSLRSRVNDNLELDAFFGRLADISGYDLHVVNQNGDSLFRELPAVPVQIRSQIPHIADRSPTVPNGYGVPVPLAGRTAAYLIALERKPEAGAGLIAVRHIATIVAVELATVYRHREASRRAGAEILAEVLAGRRLGAEARRAVEGLRTGSGELTLVAIRDMHERPTNGDELYHDLEDRGVNCMLLGNSQALFMLVGTAGQGIEQSLSGLELAAGVSESFKDLGDINIRKAQALWAVERSASKDTHVLRFDQSEGWMTWLPHDVDNLRSIANRVLAPLLEYDDEHKTDLVHTLRIYLENDKKIGVAAAVLCIHKHTLQYRLRRIAEISGRSTARVEDISELWLALRAQSLIK